MPIIRILFFFMLAVLSGCATVGQQPQYHVEVDSLAAPTAREKHTYLLLPGNEGITWDDLQFQEYALYLMRVLNSQGFISADKAEDADVAIVLSYGIGDPQTHQYSYALPVWGKTGVSSSHTYGHRNCLWQLCLLLRNNDLHPNIWCNWLYDPAWLSNNLLPLRSDYWLRLQSI